MDISDYQDAANETAFPYLDASIDFIMKVRSAEEDSQELERYVQIMCLAYTGLGLAAEAGEFCNKLKKVLRGDTTVAEAKAPLIKELGGVLWYLAENASNLEVSLDKVAEENLAQLSSRMERGVLQGSGDDR